MTTDPQLLRMELTFELDAPPDVVWQAIATSEGLSSWFIPSEVDGRVGGRVAFHMGPGPDEASVGEVTAWDPPTRLEYAEPDWPTLVGREVVGQTPLVSEFLVEARSGGTCVLRVVSSAYGTGQDWETEFFDQMMESWSPFFDTLQRYVVQFPGQTATPFFAQVQVAGDVPALWGQLSERLGGPEVGTSLDVAATGATVARVTEGAHELLLRANGPEQGFIGIGVHGAGPGRAVASVGGSLFGPTAAADAERLSGQWQAWLAEVPGVIAS